jgi:hypothetical protein
MATTLAEAEKKDGKAKVTTEILKNTIQKLCTMIRQGKSITI